MEKTLDWSLLQSFRAVAAAGSLSAAARETGKSQPTLGRRITAIETQLGAELFRRVPRGLELTEAGKALLPVADEMAESAARLALTVAGREQTLSGTVRVTASKVISHYVLPAILGDIRHQLPQIELELHASDTTENLLFREADIAVRMYRPTQLDVITRHLGDMYLGLYASRAYIARKGLLSSPDDMAQHDWVGYDRSDLIIEGFHRLGFPLDRHFFATRCDDQSAYWELTRAGCGIGACPVVIGSRDPDMIRLVEDMPIPPLPVWLTAPEALRTNARVRRVYDMLAAEIAPLLS